MNRLIALGLGLTLQLTLQLAAAEPHITPLPTTAQPATTQPINIIPAAATPTQTGEMISNPRATLGLKLWLNKDPGSIGMSQYSVGDTITVGVQPSQDAYIYLFDVGSDGHITLFAPNGYDGPRGNWVRGGVRASFPGVGAKYTLTVGGPLGQSRILALASKGPLNLQDIATFAGQQGFGSVSLQGAAALNQALSQALGNAVGNLQAGDWVTASTWYGVGEPGQGNPEVVTIPTPATPTSSIAPGEKADHSLDSAIQDGYMRVRGAASLGQASSYATPFGGGTWQKFNGVAAYGKAIIFHQAGAANAYAVHGKVLDRYLALAQAEMAQTENGPTKVPTRLGWPAGDEKILPRNTYGRTGLYAPFAAGALYSSDKGTFWLTGDLLAKYQALGGAGSSLGFPVRDQFMYNGHWAAQFEGGSLRWNGSGYAVVR